MTHPSSAPVADAQRTDAAGDTVWHTVAPQEALQRLQADPDGLDEQEVVRRQADYGRNVVPAAAGVKLLQIILHQFLNPLIYILAIAAVISVVIGEIADAVFIIVVILVNAALGAFQEWRAERSAAALQQMLTVQARVRRDGHVRQIDAEELVPGDIVMLESGDRVPADMRLLQARELMVDESFLTGESQASRKQTQEIGTAVVPVGDRLNMAYAGSTVLAGRASGLVTDTGLKTEIGRIAEAVTQTTATRPPLLIRMERFVRNISIVVIASSVLLAVISYWQGRPFEEVFFLAVALAVSAIPEGLPVAMTVALSVAVYRMSRRHVIVRRMPAVEGLGSCTYLASDKTGTLTVNRQTVKQLWLPGGRRFEVTGEGYEPEGVVQRQDQEADGDPEDVKALARVAAISNDAGLWQEHGAWKYQGDAVEVALLALAHKAGLDVARERSAEAVGDIPFESERKYAARFYRADGQVRVAVKGAMERLAEFSTKMRTPQGVVEIDREQISREAHQLAAEGYRVLAFASGEVAGEALQGRAAEGADGQDEDGAEAELGEEQLPELVFLGLVGMIDPLRPEARAAVEECRRAGVQVAMITGDHPATAAAISQQLGIIDTPQEVVTGQQLAEMDPKSEQFTRAVESSHVFARVAPLQKLEIVDALGRLGHFTAVTGDGVNDAPALRRANIGVAMGSGTDVAKDAAAIIVTDDNFASIVRGIREGRFAYDNIRKVIYLLVSTGAAEIVLFLAAIIGGMPLPLVPVQILWLNLVTNGIQDKALAFEAGEPETMGRPPRRPTEGIFNRLMISEVATAGAWMGSVCFGVWLWLMREGWDEAEARNIILLLMVLFQNFHLFNARSEYRSVFGIPLGRNWLLVLCAAGALGLHLLVMQVGFMQTVLGVAPVSWPTFLALLGLAATVLLLMECFKLVWRRMAPQQA